MPSADPVTNALSNSVDETTTRGCTQHALITVDEMVAPQHFADVDADPMHVEFADVAPSVSAGISGLRNHHRVHSILRMHHAGQPHVWQPPLHAQHPVQTYYRARMAEYP